MLVLGHRGASSAHPENTIEAFLGALAQGADGVELDVRRTSDGQLAVRHDPELPDGRPIQGLRAAELPSEVPSLAEVLDACAGARVVNVEVKNWPDDIDFDPSAHLSDAVVGLLEARGQLDDPALLVTAFHLPTLDRVHELAPGLATGWLVVDAREHEALVAQAVAHGHRALNPHHAFVSPELVTTAHAAGLAINTWTVDNPERIVWLASVGVDAVIANDPAGALAAPGR